MRVLILSCNTGQGHNAAGKAILEQITQQGHNAVMLDIMLLAGKRTSKIVGGSYVGIVNHAPHLFHLLYCAGDKISSSKRKSPVYYANTLLSKCLYQYLQENDFDIIVTPHLFAAEVLTYMKSKAMLKQKVVAIGTDYTCIPFWEETNCDYYILPHKDLIDEYVQKGIPKEKLLPYGIPVSLSFYKSKNKQEAKKFCRLPTDKKAYLIMSGSMGFGNIYSLANALIRQNNNGEQIVIICGNNKKMLRGLKRKFGNNRNIHILGFTERVSDYMDACDVVFTKPGGLTSTEAAVKNIPIVHTAPIPGCETKNLRFFVSRGMSASAKNTWQQAHIGKMLAIQKKTREDMLLSQRKNMNIHASLDIFHLLMRLVREGNA